MPAVTFSTTSMLVRMAAALAAASLLVVMLPWQAALGDDTDPTDSASETSGDAESEPGGDAEAPAGGEGAAEGDGGDDGDADAQGSAGEDAQSGVDAEGASSDPDSPDGEEDSGGGEASDDDEATTTSDDTSDESDVSPADDDVTPADSLAPPANLFARVVTGFGGAITLTWDESPAATDYRIWFGALPDGVLLDSVSAPCAGGQCSWSTTVFPSGPTQVYSVTAENEGDGSSDPVSVTAYLSPPQPGNATASLQADGSVELVWSPPTGTPDAGFALDGYHIYEWGWRGSVEEVMLTSEQPTAGTTYTVQEPAGGFINYRVTAVYSSSDGSSVSESQSSFGFVTIAAAPLDLQGVVDNGEVVLTWTSYVGDGECLSPEGFDIRRGGVTLDGANPSMDSDNEDFANRAVPVTFRDIDPGTGPFDYEVRAVYVDNCSQSTLVSRPAFWSAGQQPPGPPEDDDPTTPDPVSPEPAIPPRIPVEDLLPAPTDEQSPTPEATDPTPEEPRPVPDPLQPPPFDDPIAQAEPIPDVEPILPPVVEETPPSPVPADDADPAQDGSPGTAPSTPGTPAPSPSPVLSVAGESPATSVIDVPDAPEQLPEAVEAAEPVVEEEGTEVLGEQEDLPEQPEAPSESDVEVIAGPLEIDGLSALPGGIVVVQGDGCPVNGQVVVVVGDAEPTLDTAEADGTFSVAVTAPSSPGQYDIVVECGDTVRTIPLSVVVTTSTAGVGSSMVGTVLAFFLLIGFAAWPRRSTWRNEIGVMD